jgi:hypothetical protein
MKRLAPGARSSPGLLPEARDGCGSSLTFAGRPWEGFPTLTVGNSPDRMPLPSNAVSLTLQRGNPLLHDNIDRPGSKVMGSRI